MYYRLEFFELLDISGGGLPHDFEPIKHLILLSKLKKPSFRTWGISFEKQEIRIN